MDCEQQNGSFALCFTNFFSKIQTSDKCTAKVAQSALQQQRRYRATSEQAYPGQQT